MYKISQYTLNTYFVVFKFDMTIIANCKLNCHLCFQIPILVILKPLLTFYIIGTEALDKFMFYIIGTEALDKFMFYIIGTEALSTEDFFLDKDKAYSDMQGYKNSKLCNVLMTQSLAKQLDGTNVTCICVCPGKIICH